MTRTKSSQSTSSLGQLVDALRCLPGVGPKSAQRMVYHLLQHDRAGAARLAESLQHTLAHIQHCTQCNTYTEQTICELCQNPKREAHKLCIIETPTDLLLLEQTHTWRGLYFVLMGHLSPLDGIGADDIHIPKLIQRVQTGQITDVVIATGFSQTGEATAYYIAEVLKQYGVNVTRLARGVPIGSDLESIDLGTLAHAMFDRRAMNEL